MTIQLQPLDGDAAQELVGAAAAEGLLQHEVSAITDRAGGNPLFLQELVASSRTPEDEALPESVEDAGENVLRQNVVEARRHRYLMLNAPETALPAISALVAPRVPSVLPLAEPGMLAVHALVPAAEIWRLLPALEAAGGSSILILPVERMAA